MIRNKLLRQTTIETVTMPSFILCCTVVNNQLVKMKYVGYSARDARKKFQQYINELPQ